MRLPLPAPAAPSARSRILNGDYFTDRSGDRPLTVDLPQVIADQQLAVLDLLDLVAATSGTDSDWVVKRIDVYPDDNGPVHPGGVPAAVFVGDGTMPVALRSRESVTSGLTRPEDFVLAPDQD